MAEKRSQTGVYGLASIELNLLHFSGGLPGADMEGIRLGPGTPIHDPNGEVLFHRFPFVRDGVSVGYADVSEHSVFGAPLLAVAPHAIWDGQALLAEAQDAFHQRDADWARKGEGEPYDELRFVAYSYPKIAVQFLRGEKEVVLLECYTWIPVPPARAKRRRMQPGNFERWSLIDESPADLKRGRRSDLRERINLLSHASLQPARGGLINRTYLLEHAEYIRLNVIEEIHFSRRNSDHHVCFELRGQETNVWCVGASVQMLLDFYRYNYSQTLIAQRLNLGTPSNPNGLPYGNEGDVVTQLHAMSSNALTAAMIGTPSFADHAGELHANRPVISFIPGHSRCVAGYTESGLHLFSGPIGFRGLLVYDPWPPNAGVITRWENFDTQTYRFVFTAHVTTV